MFKIDPLKTAQANLLDMINEFAKIQLIGDEYSIGLPSAQTPTPPEDTNSVFVLTAQPGSGFTGSVNIRYRRLSIGNTFVGAPASYDVVSAVTRSQLIAQIIEEHQLIESEVTFTGLEEMPTGGSNGELTCTAVANSYFYTGELVFTVTNTDAPPYALNEYFGQNVGALYGTPEQPIPEGVPIYVLQSVPYGTTTYNDSVSEFMKKHIEETYPGIVINNVGALGAPSDTEIVRDYFGADMTPYGDTCMSGVFNSTTDPELNAGAFFCWDRPNFSDKVLNTPFTIATEVQTLDQIFKYYIARMYNLAGLPPDWYTITGTVPAENGQSQVISINITEGINWMYRPAVAPIQITVTKNNIGVPPGWVYPAPALGFNNSGNIDFEAIRGEFDNARIIFRQDGAVDTTNRGSPDVLGANIPTNWLTNGPIPNAGNDYEIKFLFSNIDMGPSIYASLVAGGNDTDITFESEPYESEWTDLSMVHWINMYKEGNMTGGTVEGTVTIRHKTTLATISRGFRLFVHP